MRKTALRSPAMHTKYLTFPKDPNFMVNSPSIVDYHYWRIIDNAFPYDNVAKIHNLLIPKRQFAHEWDMTKKEEVELKAIRRFYLEDYDAVMENLGANRSVQNWYHLHFLKFKIV